MDSKWIVISVITAMAAILVFASTAAAIVVDGDGSDWAGLPTAGLDTAVDTDGIMELPVNACPDLYMLNWSSGYDMADFAMYYDAPTDTLYFKINLSGVPGDTDGDYNPSGCTYCNFSGPIGNCSDPWDTWPRASADHPGVTVGAYLVRLDVDGDGNEDHRVIYKQNRVWVMDETEISDHSDNFTWVGSIGYGPWSAANVTNVVEMSITPAHNMSGFGMCNDFIIKEVSCGTGNDYLPEDPIHQFTANLAPVSIPVGDPVCYCTNTSFDGSGSQDLDGTIVLYEWDFDGDGTTDATGVTASHHFAVGDHTVTLTVTDDYGFKCSNTTTVRVYENPTANFTATEVDFCTNTTFNDITTGGTPPYTYRWDFDNDSTYELEGDYPNPTYHYPAAGDYTACLSITDSRGCTDKVCKPVHVKNLPPVAEFGFNGTGCKVGILNASASYDPDGNITTYEWDLNDDGVYDNGTGVTCTFGPVPVPPEDYWIGLMVTDDAGVSNTTRKQVSLTGDPVANATADGGDGPVQIPGGGKTVTFCGNESHHPYSADGADIVSYNWTILGVAHSTTDPDECFDVFVNETTTVYLRVVDNYGCEHTDSVHLEKMPPVHEDVPLLTPAGMIALIGMLCIICVGRIAKKGRRL